MSRSGEEPLRSPARCVYEHAALVVCRRLCTLLEQLAAGDAPLRVLGNVLHGSPPDAVPTGRRHDVNRFNQHTRVGFVVVEPAVKRLHAAHVRVEIHAAVLAQDGVPDRVDLVDGRLQAIKDGPKCWERGV